jgi:hypothetical protein
VLLRESFRVDGKVKKRTLANLSALPSDVIEGLKVLLQGGTAFSSVDDVLTIERSLPHGHVAAVLGSAKLCGAFSWFESAPAPLRSTLMAMLLARILDPGSKLATRRMLCDDTAINSLGKMLGVGDPGRDDLYEALDWLLAHQDAIERRLAKKHLVGASLVLYDLTSTWLTGNCCELAAHGYSRDGKRGDMQIVFGLVCTAQGCPIAVEVFAGNTADPATVATQIEKLQTRFGISELTWVGDRGMLTQKQIDTELRPKGLRWISSLRAPAIAELAVEKGPFQPSLFDERGFIELVSEQFPGERLIVCRNPLLAEDRARTRTELLYETEKDLTAIQTATRRARNPLRGSDEIGIRIGKVIGKHKMAKHFDLHITDDSFTWNRKQDQIDDEASRDGLYVVRTNVDAAVLSGADAVTAYKGLSVVERAFRSIKTVDLQVRPIFHWNADRVRAHVLLCMLAYYVEWHMRQLLKPMLFDDEDLDIVHAARTSPVTKAQRSDSAKQKDRSKQNSDGVPVHSFRTLLKDLATLTYNITHTATNPNAKIVITTRPTPLQEKAFKLLAVNPACTQ